MHDVATPRNSLRTPIDASAVRQVVSGTRVMLLSGVTAAFSGFLLGLAGIAVARNAMPLWLVARAAGITAYLLLTLVTAMGLVLSHNTRARLRPHPSRIRLHLALVVFTLTFTAMHIAVLVLDPYAKVGLLGALLPLGAAYRPVPVTLGLLSLWSGLIAGASAGMAGRGTGRIWLYLHRLAGSGWVLAWAHAVLTGVDTPALAGMYVITGLGVIGLAMWRYLATDHAVASAQSDREAVVVR